MNQRSTHANPGPVLVALSAAIFAAAGCSSSSSSAGADNSQVFVAYAPDFSGFHSWQSTPGVGPAGAPQPPTSSDGGLHAGPLTTYINKPPPHGSKEFPVGTIIVKEPSDAPLTERQIFAMVKRGGNYDVSGATNWEWFELRNADANTVTILWRGIGPTAGEAYAATPNLCNDCHRMASNNDFVWTSGLDLSSF